MPNGTFSQIPKTELAPGMINIDLKGHGRVWVRQDQFAEGSTRSEYQHPPFDDGIRKMFAEIKEVFDPYYSRTLDEWEDGFRRDRNADQEIAMWLFSAEKMKKHAPGAASPRNWEVYKLITNAMINGSDGAKLTFESELLTKEEIETILGPDKD